MSRDNRLAIIDITLWASPGDDPIPNAVVLIEGSTIVEAGPAGTVALPSGYVTRSAGGGMLTAGFWNAHVHFAERKWASAASAAADELQEQLGSDFLCYGFTSVFDLGSPWANTQALRARIAVGEIAGPRILSTGPGLIPKGGLPSRDVLAVMGWMTDAPLTREVTNAEDASAQTRAILDSGVDGLKLFASAPRSEAMSMAAMRAAIETAREHNKPAFVHPNTMADVFAAVEAGIDVIAHTTPDGTSWNEEIVNRAVANGVALIPTLTLWKYYGRHDRPSEQERTTRACAEQLRAWRRAGGAVLFGTDLGAVGPDPSEEYSLMASAGMDARAILRALTVQPARRFGGRLDGRVAPGFRADVTILGSDPRIDLAALTDVRCVIRHGRVVYEASST